MIESSGAVPVLEPTRALSLLVALPLAWALSCAATRRHAEKAAAALALATLAVSSLVLAKTLSAIDRGRGGIVEHVSSVARLGSLDLRVDLVADARSAVATTTVALLASIAVVVEVSSRREGAARRLGWLGCLVAAVFAVTLGDGLGAMLVGAQLATLATFALAGEGSSRPVRALLVATSGDGALVLAACLLFWSLGGTFGPSGYVSDQGPRAALVSTGAPDGHVHEATLAVAAYGGARVVSDRDVPLPGEPLVTPFVATVDPGVVSFRIVLGPASPDVLATNVTLSPGATHVLVPLAPTTSLREVAERARIAAREAQPDVLASRVLGAVSIRVVLAVLLAWALVARLSVAACAREASVGASFAVVVTMDLAVRASPILGEAGLLFAGLAGAGALVLGAWAASRASRQPGARSAQGAVVGASAALAAVAAGAGEPGAALALGVSAAFGATAVAIVPRGGDGQRWAPVAAAVSVGLLPCAGVSAGLVGTVASLLRRAGPAPLLVLATSILAIVLAALGARRSIDAAPREGLTSRPFASAVAAFATFGAVASGPVLGVGARVFASASASLADRSIATTVAWPLGQRTADGPSALVSLASVFLVTAAAVLEWRAGAAGASGALVAWLDRRLSLFVRTGDALGASASVMARGVVVIDHEVLEDAGRVAASGIVRGAEALARISPGAVGDRMSTALLARVGLDDPRAATRLRQIVTVLGVAIPVLLVLSSWLLG